MARPKHDRVCAPHTPGSRTSSYAGIPALVDSLSAKMAAAALPVQYFDAGFRRCLANAEILAFKATATG